MTDLSKLVRDLEHPTVLELKLAEALESARREAMQECAEICENAIASPISEPFMTHCADLIRARMEVK